jgi:Tol biopolymer transport system component
VFNYFQVPELKLVAIHRKTVRIIACLNSQFYQKMFRRPFIIILIAIFLLLSGAACQRNPFQNPPSIVPLSLRNVPALRLNYRFEPDVPAPTQEPAPIEERNAAVQVDFDENRPQEILDNTITSPDQQKVIAVYHDVRDLATEFRLDMYSADGKLLKKITHAGMAVHFPGTIIWSPDSTSVAFVAMVRLANATDSTDKQTEGNLTPETPADTEPDATAENINSETPANTETANTEATPVDEAQPVLTFRTEQLYICDANGNDLKPLTQNEGLIYFYFVWSPDGSALAALAVRQVEWKVWEYQANQSGQMFKPAGRPRIIEKTGRERLLDDNLTPVHPVWSPDSSKIAAAFDKQVRIYDAIGDAPTQAAIPLRNQLIISSKAYDETKKQELGVENLNAETNVEANGAKKEEKKETPANSNANTNANLPPGVLPDAANLVSLNPIVDLLWTEDAMLYFETAYVREFKDSANNVRSYSRWHRLILSPQAVVLGNPNNTVGQ